MINKKIAICTVMTMQPEHPRIVSEMKVLHEAGHDVKIIHSTYTKSEMSKFYKILFYLTLSFFRWDLIFKFRNLIPKDSHVIIYDFALLPLLFFVSRKNRKVIYETEDNNVHLTVHYLSGFRIFRPFKKIVTRIFSAFERWAALTIPDQIIVNSKALAEYFDGHSKVKINYYTSPYESTHLDTSNLNKTVALVYLGIFSENKGAREILDIREKLQCKLYIYGDNIYGCKPSEDIIIKNRVNAEVVSQELEELSKMHRFIGLSLIKPVHFSYATQEANKDIDYMCLGVPFIGNRRIPTYEKILRVC